MTHSISRRSLLAVAGALLGPPLRASSGKKMRGVFVIAATPFTDTKAVDYEDLAREVDFLDRWGVHGLVWPQMASEYTMLTKDERLQGMETLARAARGKKPALVFGVQGPNTDAALEYLKHAEKLNPDAVIAIPPTEATTFDDFRNYYRALARNAKRPLFVQTTGGAKNIEPRIDFLVELAKEFPHCGYIKEEHNPVIPRMTELARHRPAVKSVMSGGGGRSMLYEARLGFDGTMPGACYGDIHAQVWDLADSGKTDAARDLFAKLLLMLNCDQQITGTRLYVMKKRGVFKTWMSRRTTFDPTPEAMAEIDHNLAALKPYLRS
ncbi:MAG: dihydrodipicolinate synthase family protein [Bryobacterales bacterium]|nr:dihydrodipicolinate synthase family protein [Bryobacterales bacterium]